MNAILSRPQVDFMRNQLTEIDKILVAGNYDAQQVLQRTRSLIQVVQSTLETAVWKEDFKGYMFAGFDS